MNTNSRQFQQAVRELGLKINQNAIQDRLELEEILCNILCYPDRRKADIHHRSNNIGKNDLFAQQRANQLQIKQNGLKNLKICECCGMLTKNNQIPYCTNLNKLNIGIGVHMFFTNYLFHALLFLLFFAIYSIYALITNIEAYFQKTGSTAICIGTGCSVSFIGAGSKLVSLKPSSYDRMDTLNQIQSYIGIGFVALWGFLYILKTYLEQKFVMKTEENKIYASDFTLLLTNVPKQYFIKEYVATAKIKSARINAQGKYQQNVHGKFAYLEPNEILDKFNKQMINYGRKKGSQYSYEVFKVNIAMPLYQKKQEKIKREKKQKSTINKKLNVLRGFIEQYKYNKRFLTKQRERDRAKQDAVSTIIGYDYQKQLRKVDLADENVVFLTMKHSKALDEIQHCNRPPSIQNFWNCCRESEFPLRGVKVRRAPHPQQIKWESIGFPKYQKRLRRFIVWILTLVLIGISFGINLGISSQRKKGNIQNSIGLSIAISIVISVINIGIQILVTLASYLQNQYIMSRQQSSVAVKVAFSQLINSIGVPIFLQLIFYNNESTNWLGANGLVNDVFFIALINVAVPIALFFDPWEIYLRLVRWWYSRPMNKLYIHRQKQFNKLFGNYTFDIGYQYAYLIKTSIFTAFFVCMQPIIALFAPFGFLFYYLATKRNFLRHFQRPKYHFTTINKIVDIMLLFSLIAFGLGCLFVNNFVKEQFNGHYNSKLLYLNLIIVGIGLFFLIVVPLRLFYHCMKRPVSLAYDYKVQEPNITTDFDRLNPQTQQKALSEFKKLLEDQSKIPNKVLREQANFNLNQLILRQTQKRQQQEQNQIIANRMSKIHESLPRNDETPDPVYNNNLEDYKEIINTSNGKPHQANLQHHQKYAPVPDSAQSHSGDQL